MSVMRHKTAYNRAKTVRVGCLALNFKQTAHKDNNKGIRE